MAAVVVFVYVQHYKGFKFAKYHGNKEVTVDNPGDNTAISFQGAEMSL